MKNLFYPILLILALFLNSCSSEPDNVDLLTYEVFNSEKHIEVTKNNMIQLIEFSDNQLEELLLEIEYEKNDKGESEFSYIQKTDTVSGVFQIIEVRYAPERIVDVTWVSLDDKDRFSKFIEDVKNPDDFYVSTEDAYFLTQDNKDYIAIIADLVVAKKISIMKMD